MYQLLTGERPFTGSAETIAYKVCHEKPRLPSEVDPARCTDQFDAVVMTALAKKAEERFQEARVFRDAVLEAHAAPPNPTLSEETILNVPVRPSAQLEPSQPSQPSRPSHPSRPSQPSQPSQPQGSTPGAQAPASKTVPPPGWEAATLKQIEQQLARHVGPVAKVLVRRGATQTTDIDQLYRMLAENLANPDERAAFLAARPQAMTAGVAVEAGAAATAHAAATALTMQLTPEAIEQATKRLAAYLGPIAKVAAKKAAPLASSRRHFYLLLAENLANPTDRSQFLHDVGVE
jgi:serine/threonine-protein kinase